MKTQLKRASLEAVVASLRASVSSSLTSTVVVDEAAGTILGANVMSIGPARGHGWSIDTKTLSQVASLINSQPDGVKIRFTHPEATVDEDGRIIAFADDLGSVIGRLRNARVEGDSVRGDIYLGDYAAVLPGQGDVRSYLLKRAKQDPAGLGLSAVIGCDVEPVINLSGQPTDLVARVFTVDAVDFVGEGAATPNGLLAAKPIEPNSKAYWYASLALAHRNNDPKAIARAVCGLRTLGVRLSYGEQKQPKTRQAK